MALPLSRGTSLLSSCSTPPPCYSISISFICSTGAKFGNNFNSTVLSDHRILVMVEKHYQEVGTALSTSSPRCENFPSVCNKIPREKLIDSWSLTKNMLKTVRSQGMFDFQWHWVTAVYWWCDIWQKCEFWIGRHAFCSESAYFCRIDKTEQMGTYVMTQNMLEKQTQKFLEVQWLTVSRRLPKKRAAEKSGIKES